MPSCEMASRRLTAFDVAQAGSMEMLVQQTVEQLKYGNSETKEFGANVVRTLTEMRSWVAPEGKGDKSLAPKDDSRPAPTGSTGSRAVPAINASAAAAADMSSSWMADNIALIMKADVITPLVQVIATGTSNAQRDASARGIAHKCVG